MDDKTENAITTVSPSRVQIQQVNPNRPLAEIMQDLSKRVPEHLLSKVPQKWFEAQREARDKEARECRKRHYPLDLLPYDVPRKFIPWYNAVRLLNHYAPGWIGEIRNIAIPGKTASTFVTVVYRITLKGSDGEVCREASATSTMDYNDHSVYFSPVQNAEREAFCKTCLLFGLGLYLYHSPDAPPGDHNSGRRRRSWSFDSFVSGDDVTTEDVDDTASVESGSSKSSASAETGRKARRLVSKSSEETSGGSVSELEKYNLGRGKRQKLGHPEDAQSPEESEEVGSDEDGKGHEIFGQLGIGQALVHSSPMSYQMFSSTLVPLEASPMSLARPSLPQETWVPSTFPRLTQSQLQAHAKQYKKIKRQMVQSRKAKHDLGVSRNDKEVQIKDPIADPWTLLNITSGILCLESSGVTPSNLASKARNIGPSEELSGSVAEARKFDTDERDMKASKAKARAGRQTSSPRLLADVRKRSGQSPTENKRKKEPAKSRSAEDPTSSSNHPASLSTSKATDYNLVRQESERNQSTRGKKKVTKTRSSGRSSKLVDQPPSSSNSPEAYAGKMQPNVKFQVLEMKMISPPRELSTLFSEGYETDADEALRNFMKKPISKESMQPLDTTAPSGTTVVEKVQGATPLDSDFKVAGHSSKLSVVASASQNSKLITSRRRKGAQLHEEIPDQSKRLTHKKKRASSVNDGMKISGQLTMDEDHGRINIDKLKQEAGGSHSLLESGTSTTGDAVDKMKQPGRSKKLPKKKVHAIVKASTSSSDVSDSDTVKTSRIDTSLELNQEKESKVHVRIPEDINLGVKASTSISEMNDTTATSHPRDVYVRGKASTSLSEITDIITDTFTASNSFSSNQGEEGNVSQDLNVKASSEEKEPKVLQDTYLNVKASSPLSEISDLLTKTVTTPRVDKTVKSSEEKEDRSPAKNPQLGRLSAEEKGGEPALADDLDTDTETLYYSGESDSEVDARRQIGEKNGKTVEDIYLSGIDSSSSFGEDSETDVLATSQEVKMVISGQGKGREVLVETIQPGGYFQEERSSIVVDGFRTDAKSRYSVEESEKEADTTRETSTADHGTSRPTTTDPQNQMKRTAEEDMFAGSTPPPIEVSGADTDGSSPSLKVLEVYPEIESRLLADKILQRKKSTLDYEHESSKIYPLSTLEFETQVVLPIQNVVDDIELQKTFAGRPDPGSEVTKNGGKLGRKEKKGKAHAVRDESEMRQTNNFSSTEFEIKVDTASPSGMKMDEGTQSKQSPLSVLPHRRGEMSSGEFETEVHRRYESMRMMDNTHMEQPIASISFPSTGKGQRRRKETSLDHERKTIETRVSSNEFETVESTSESMRMVVNTQTDHRIAAIAFPSIRKGKQRTKDTSPDDDERRTNETRISSGRREMSSDEFETVDRRTSESIRIGDHTQTDQPIPAIEFPATKKGQRKTKKKSPGDERKTSEPGISSSEFITAVGKTTEGTKNLLSIRGDVASQMTNLIQHTKEGKLPTKELVDAHASIVSQKNKKSSRQKIREVAVKRKTSVDDQIESDETYISSGKALGTDQDVPSYKMDTTEGTKVIQLHAQQSFLEDKITLETMMSFEAERDETSEKLKVVDLKQGKQLAAKKLDLKKEKKKPLDHHIRKSKMSLPSKERFDTQVNVTSQEAMPEQLGAAAKNFEEILVRKTVEIKGSMASHRKRKAQSTRLSKPSVEKSDLQRKLREKGEKSPSISMVIASQSMDMVKTTAVKKKREQKVDSLKRGRHERKKIASRKLDKVGIIEVGQLDVEKVDLQKEVNQEGEISSADDQSETTNREALKVDGMESIQFEQLNVEKANLQEEINQEEKEIFSADDQIETSNRETIKVDVFKSINVGQIGVKKVDLQEELNQEEKEIFAADDQIETSNREASKLDEVESIEIEQLEVEKIELQEEVNQEEKYISAADDQMETSNAEAIKLDELESIEVGQLEVEKVELQDEVNQEENYISAASDDQIETSNAEAIKVYESIEVEQLDVAKVDLQEELNQEEKEIFAADDQIETSNMEALKVDEMESIKVGQLDVENFDLQEELNQEEKEIFAADNQIETINMEALKVDEMESIKVGQLDAENFDLQEGLNQEEKEISATDYQNKTSTIEALKVDKMESIEVGQLDVEKVDLLEEVNQEEIISAADGLTEKNNLKSLEVNEMESIEVGQLDVEKFDLPKKQNQEEEISAADNQIETNNMEALKVNEVESIEVGQLDVQNIDLEKEVIQEEDFSTTDDQVETNNVEALKLNEVESMEFGQLDVENVEHQEEVNQDEKKISDVDDETETRNMETLKVDEVDSIQVGQLHVEKVDLQEQLNHDEKEISATDGEIEANNMEALNPDMDIALLPHNKRLGLERKPGQEEKHVDINIVENIKVEQHDVEELDLPKKVNKKHQRQMAVDLESMHDESRLMIESNYFTQHAPSTSLENAEDFLEDQKSLTSAFETLDSEIGRDPSSIVSSDVSGAMTSSWLSGFQTTVNKIVSKGLETTGMSFFMGMSSSREELYIGEERQATRTDTSMSEDIILLEELEDIKSIETTPTVPAEGFISPTVKILPLESLRSECDGGKETRMAFFSSSVTPIKQVFPMEGLGSEKTLDNLEDIYAPSSSPENTMFGRVMPWSSNIKPQEGLLTETERNMETISVATISVSKLLSPSEEVHPLDGSKSARFLETPLLDKKFSSGSRMTMPKTLVTEIDEGQVVGSMMDSELTSLALPSSPTSVTFAVKVHPIDTSLNMRYGHLENNVEAPRTSPTHTTLINSESSPTGIRMHFSLESERDDGQPPRAQMKLKTNDTRSMSSQERAEGSNFGPKLDSLATNIDLASSSSTKLGHAGKDFRNGKFIKVDESSRLKTNAMGKVMPKISKLETARLQTIPKNSPTRTTSINLESSLAEKNLSFNFKSERSDGQAPRSKKTLKTADLGSMNPSELAKMSTFDTKMASLVADIHLAGGSSIKLGHAGKESRDVKIHKVDESSSLKTSTTRKVMPKTSKPERGSQLTDERKEVVRILEMSILDGPSLILTSTASEEKPVLISTTDVKTIDPGSQIATLDAKVFISEDPRVIFDKKEDVASSLKTFIISEPLSNMEGRTTEGRVITNITVVTPSSITMEVDKGRVVVSAPDEQTSVLVRTLPKFATRTDVLSRGDKMIKEEMTSRNTSVNGTFPTLKISTTDESQDIAGITIGVPRIYKVEADEGREIEAPVIVSSGSRFETSSFKSGITGMQQSKIDMDEGQVTISTIDMRDTDLTSSTSSSKFATPIGEVHSQGEASAEPDQTEEEWKVLQIPSTNKPLTSLMSSTSRRVMPWTSPMEFGERQEIDSITDLNTNSSTLALSPKLTTSIAKDIPQRNAGPKYAQIKNVRRVSKVFSKDESGSNVKSSTTRRVMPWTSKGEVTDEENGRDSNPNLTNSVVPTSTPKFFDAAYPPTKIQVKKSVKRNFKTPLIQGTLSSLKGDTGKNVTIGSSGLRANVKRVPRSVMDIGVIGLATTSTSNFALSVAEPCQAEEMEHESSMMEHESSMQSQSDDNTGPTSKLKISLSSDSASLKIRNTCVSVPSIVDLIEQTPNLKNVINDHTSQRQLLLFDRGIKTAKRVINQQSEVLYMSGCSKLSTLGEDGVDVLNYGTKDEMDEVPRYTTYDTGVSLSCLDLETGFGSSLVGVSQPTLDSDASGITKLTPLTLGLETEGGVMTVIIPRNTYVPVQRKQLISTHIDNQTELLVHIFEGERLWVRDNKMLGSFEVKGIAPAPRGEPLITICFDIDAKGVLNIFVDGERTLGGQTIKGLPISNVSVRPHREKILEMIEEAEKYKVEEEENRKKIELKDSLENYVYKMRNIINDKRIVNLLGPKDQKEMMVAVQAALSWLQVSNWILYNQRQIPEFQEVDMRRKELQNICEPILEKVFQGQRHTWKLETGLLRKNQQKH